MGGSKDREPREPILGQYQAIASWSRTTCGGTWKPARNMYAFRAMVTFLRI